MTSGSGGTPAVLIGMVGGSFYEWASGVASLQMNFRGYYSTGNKQTGASSTSYGDSWAVGDRMGVAVDLDNDAIYFAKNNTYQNSGDPTSGASKTGAAFTDLTFATPGASGAEGTWVPFYHSGGNRGATVLFNEDDFDNVF